MKKLPLVSIVIVNYNGKKYLLDCLKSVFKNTYPDCEVVVVDNGSKDGSLEEVRKRFAKKKNFQVLALEKNYGPAYARNRGVEKARGKYLAFLDNDTLPDKDWLVSLVKTMVKDKKIGACQCKLLLKEDRERFDYAGDYLSQYGFLIQRVEAGVIDKGQVDQKGEILSAKSAAMMIRKDVFRKIGGFDEDYFIYLEETDLGWRTWLAGFKVVFVPESKVYHEFGTTTLIDPKLQNYNLKFHGTKNYLTTLIKNLELINLLKILPIHLFLWLGMAFLMVWKRSFYQSGLILKAIFWNFAHLPRIMKKRKQIQTKRKISDKKLFPKIMRKRKFKYFYNKFAKPRKIGHTKGWFKQK